MTTDVKKKVLISQADNFSANFGDVYRSSAIFWAPNNGQVKTTISFSNYWMYKNNTDVAVVINVRDMQGTIVSRRPVDFTDSDVCNFVPPEGFEGSVEVEVFAIRNMRIPYAAIMAIYETRDAITMVHSYGRAYSQHEIEDGRTTTQGEESCWTLRNSAGITSFGVFHNGATPAPAQDVTLRVRNSRGEERETRFTLAEMRPFETVVIEPAAHCPGLAEFLGGEPGNARISFALSGSFTRMLCGIRTADFSQLQVTHSNFDYSSHDTDTVSHEKQIAYMHTPQAPAGVTEEIVVYPDTNQGNYRVESDAGTQGFTTGQIVRIPFADNCPRTIYFSRADGVLPTRIVTAMRLNGPDGVLPAECSLGVIHHARPPKHSAWMAVSQKFASQICWTDFVEVYGGMPDDAVWECSLYSALRKEPLVSRRTAAELKPVMDLQDLFDEQVDLGEEFGYLSIRSSYGGLLIFSTLRKGSSLAIEHSF